MEKPKFKTLMPIIVPREYFALKNWPGKHQRINHPELAVTWVELKDSNTMTYVNVDRHEEIESYGFNVHELAMGNLRAASVDQVMTHKKIEDHRTIFGAMMHSDGLGSSRLLLPELFDSLFPQGYWFGIPERSCGVVVPKNVTAAELQQVEGIINRCNENGLVPMLHGLFEKDAFSLTLE